MKAVILSAGFGTRLKPLTEKIPKPLVPILDIKLFEYTLDLLSRFNINKVFSNVYYLDHLFKDINVPKNIDLTIVKEKNIRGTLGGILNFKDKLIDDDFLVVNGDILFHLDLNKLINYHKKKEKIATLVLKENVKNTAVYVDDFKNIVSILKKKSSIYKEYMFTGIQVISPKIFNLYRDKKEPSCLVRDYYMEQIEIENYPSAFFLDEKDLWYEIGNLNQYLNTNIDFFNKLNRGDLENSYESFIRETLFYRKHPIKEEIKGIWKSANVHINNHILLKAPVFISENVTISNGSEIGPNALFFKNSSLLNKKNISNAIVVNDLILE